jgi:hypothetical protein
VAGLAQIEDLRFMCHSEWTSLLLFSHAVGMQGGLAHHGQHSVNESAKFQSVLAREVVAQRMVRFTSECAHNAATDAMESLLLCRIGTNFK